MYKLSLISGILLTFTTVATASTNPNFIESELEIIELESNLFENYNDESLNVNDIHVVELEEEVEIDFDVTAHLPENFNALKGKNDIDWSSVELIELEEDIELGFNTKSHLPENFNPYKGMFCNKQKHVVVVVSVY